MITIEKLDHLVITVRDIETTCDFYGRVLGMEIITFGQNRKALAFGQQKSTSTKSARNLNPKQIGRPSVRPIYASSLQCLLTKW